MRHWPSDCDTWGQTAFETDAVAWIATISLFYFILTNNTNTIAGRDQRSCIIMAIILAYIWMIENPPCFVFPHKPHKKRCGTAKYWTADLDNSWKYATFRLITHTHHTLSLSLSPLTTLVLTKVAHSEDKSKAPEENYYSHLVQKGGSRDTFSR